MKKELKILIFIAGAFVFFKVVLIINTIWKEKQTMKKEQAKELPSLQKLTSLDSQLFSEKSINHIKAVEVWLSEIRNPMSITTFDEKYYLLFHKLDLKSTFSLRDSLKIAKLDIGTTDDVAYRVFKIDDYFEFDFSNRIIDQISDININLSGDSILKTLDTDSIINYHFSCKNMSIRYAPKDAVDIYLGVDQSINGNSRIDTDLLFWRRANFVYLFVMFPIDSKETIDKNLISKILR